LHDEKKFEVLEKIKKSECLVRNPPKRNEYFLTGLNPFLTFHIAKQRKYKGFNKKMLVLANYCGIRF
jgi:hypothetical protein